MASPGPHRPRLQTPAGFGPPAGFAMPGGPKLPDASGPLWTRRAIWVSAAATVKVHMAYGFGGIRKLDLEAGTNSDGKVRFKGLPAKVHNPPLEFHASKDDLAGLASFNPATECQAKHDIILEKVKPPAGF